MITSAVAGDCLELGVDSNSSDASAFLCLRFSLESALFMPAGLDSVQIHVHAFSVISPFAVSVTWHPTWSALRLGALIDWLELRCVFSSRLSSSGVGCEEFGIIVVEISDLLGLQC